MNVKRQSDIDNNPKNPCRCNPINSFFFHIQRKALIKMITKSFQEINTQRFGLITVIKP